MDPQTQLELEAAAFRRLRQHLMEERTDVQNIDMSKDEGREAFYGMPFSEWKATYQTEASREVKAAFEASHAKD